MHRPCRTSKLSLAGNEDNTATPNMDIVRSLVGPITTPSIDFDFSAETSSDAQLLEPVAEESTAPRSSSLSATQQVESILVAAAASAFSEPRWVLSFHSSCALTICARLQTHLPKLREPLPVFSEPIHDRQRIASNEAASRSDLSFADASSLLQGLSFHHCLETLYMDHTRLLANWVNSKVQMEATSQCMNMPWILKEPSRLIHWACYTLLLR